MNIITQSIRNEKEYAGLLANAITQSNSSRPHPMSLTGLCDGASEAFYVEFVADVKRETGRGVLLICPDEKSQSRLKTAFESCGKKSLVYPYRDFVFYNITASHEYEHERLNVLYAVKSGDYDVVLATPDAALQYTVPQELLSESEFTVD